MKIFLTKNQARIMWPLFEKIRKAFESGKPGMIVGQFEFLDDGGGFFDVRFLNFEKSKQLQKICGGKGLPTGKKIEIVAYDADGEY